MHANITASCVTELVLYFVLAFNSFACEDDVAEGKSYWYLTVYRTESACFESVSESDRLSSYALW